MSIIFEDVSFSGNNDAPVYNINLTFESGSVTVLLGQKGSKAGKSTLIKLIAGLIKPTHGKIIIDGIDATNIPVQKRNVAMVHQQIINYPHMSVFENIASPLQVMKFKKLEIQKEVIEVAKLLRIENCLDRYPSELSGGQQQRTALARALVKRAKVILLNDPFVNLDYKLREELRGELKSLLKTRNTIAIYATQEAQEAMALGGTSVLLQEGRVIQQGPASDVYRQPLNIDAAMMLSDPALSVFLGRISGHEVSLGGSLTFPKTHAMDGVKSGQYFFALRPGHIRLTPFNDDDLELSMRVELAEISGSGTIIHTANSVLKLVLNLAGVHEYKTDSMIKVYIPLHKLFIFDQNKFLIKAPDESR
ncbi:ABC transporter ATP-binding protein [Paraglaciecola sp.]|uniref:ABC transporter ATP-binding protein n=1 Tax=Paraglaciecola sp. TaxID=1920173 RepID=UPI0030F46623